MQTLLMHPDDNVAQAVADLPAGQTITVAGDAVALRQAIPSGHKLARRPIVRGELVLKYGQPIGRATAEIAAGDHVHVHNVESLRGRGDLGSGGREQGAGGRIQGAGVATGAGLSTVPPHAAFPGPVGDQPEPISLAGAGLPIVPPTHATFLGYRRRDGRVGVRNHVLVLASVQCANAVVDAIGRGVPQVVALSHVWGCSQIGDDLAQTQRVLEEFASHPNVAATLLIGLGCESMPTVAMGEALAARGVTIRRLTIQEEGGSRATIGRGIAIARELLAEAAKAQREPIPLSELIVGLECGGSDAWSGVTANPAVGIASDLLVQAGGTAILSEVPEFIGAEHLLAARAASPEVGRRIVAATLGHEAAAMRMGVDLRGAQPTPGNIAGGLTTIEEKSMGAIAKGGSTPVQEFLPYAHRPTRRGLVVMDTPGNDTESVTAMVAGGSQVVVFTTGRGSPTGCPIAPVIKVATNSAMYRRLSGDMDLDAGTIIEMGEPLADAGRRVFAEIVAVANGQETAAELLGAREFAINVIGPRL
ncbi:MAG: altronate dehydratase family protein [Chloroflexi bacterium]|nr:altronate dehydratase family protein [Chloroflexota bacterium]